MEKPERAKPPRIKRADARENRAAILQAAFRQFEQEGVNATMESIAQEAGVAVGTLYHHFGTKEGLFRVVVDEGLAQAAAQIETFLGVTDPWHGVAQLVRYLAEKQRGNEAFRALLSNNPALRAYTTTTKRQLGPAIQQVLDRAKASHQLRADIVAADIPLLLMGIGVSPIEDDRFERYLAIILNGLRANGYSPPIQQIEQQREHHADEYH